MGKKKNLKNTIIENNLQNKVYLLIIKITFINTCQNQKD